MSLKSCYKVWRAPWPPLSGTPEHLCIKDKNHKDKHKCACGVELDDNGEGNGNN
jgi:hypothetical protein